MPFVYKILGQENPAANTLTTIYQVPADNSAIISTVTIANFGPENATYRIAAQKNGQNIESNHYIAFDTVIGSYDTAILTLGLTLGANDIFSANISDGNIAINVFGTETY